MTIFNMKRKAFWFSALFLALFACEKPKGALSEDVLPAGDIITFASKTGTPFLWQVEKADSIESQNLSANLLGAYSDPQTGKSTFSTNFQLRLSSSGNLFPREEMTIDSVVLAMAISDVYGNEDYLQSLEVLALDEAISGDSTYYSNKVFATESENLVADMGMQYRFDTEDFIIGGDTQTAQIRIPLSTSFGERLLLQSSDADFESNENFLNYFRGLQLKPGSEPGAGDGLVAIINPLSIFSEMNVYYTRSSFPDSTFQFTFVINGNCQRNTTAIHDFTGSAVEGEVNGSASVAPYAAVKTAGGLLSRFRITNLDTLRELAPVGIATAEVFFPVKQDDFSANFPPSEKMILVEVNDDGTFAILPDQLEGDAYFGGTYDAEKGGYTFRIARFMQQYINRTEPFYGFALIPSFSGVRANRTLLLRNEEEGAKPELIVYFAGL